MQNEGECCGRHVVDNDMNFRVNLGMTRDVPILRIKRAATGTNIRGSKPVTVYFQKYEDKEEILRSVLSYNL